MLKKALLLIILSSFCASAQVNWQPNWETAIAESKSSGKLILVECYHPTCPHCAILNENLTKPALITTLNQSFINYKLNLADFDHIEILKKHNIRLPNWPMLLFFTPEEEFINFLEPNEDSEILNAQIQDESSLSCQSCLSNPRLEMNELLKCAIYFKINQNFEANNIMSTKLFESIEENKKSSEMSWQLFKKAVASPDNTYFDYWMDHQTEARAIEKNTNVEKDVIASMLQSKALALLKSDATNKENIEDLKKNLRKLGADEAKVLSWTWNLDLIYALKTKDKAGADELCFKLTKQFPSQSSYLMLFKIINDNTTDNFMYDFYKKNKEYLEASIKSNEDKKQFYVQSAIFTGKKKETAVCKASLDSAEKFGLGLAEKQDLLEKYCID